jgi:alpha,alpha-trehalase
MQRLRFPLLRLFWLVALALPLAARADDARAAAADRQPPSLLFQELFVRVQTEGLYADSKTFADAVPRTPPEQILAAYRNDPPQTRPELAAFVTAHFALPEEAGTGPAPATATPLPLRAHIAQLWSELARQPVAPPPWSSQLPLSAPYVVPGGRFRELYYWDSYFTMLGLIRDGRRDLATSMTDAFADLIRRYGHVPNGSRTYYLSRSQPPVFYLMVELIGRDDPEAGARYLDALRREYRFWMHGEQGLRPGQAFEHVVRLPDGSVLNRYWDVLQIPRDEAYRADAALAADTDRPAPELYRALRTAAESGWDFSSRWLADGRSLATIETTAIVPVDLNSLLYGLEGSIARACARVRDLGCVGEFRGRAARRRAAVTRYLWDRRGHRFLDYQWRRGVLLDRPSAAMLYPLFVGLADARQARGVATAVRHDLLAPGGLRTTARDTGQQWDAPNGWAPLHWIAVRGLERYGAHGLAREIAGRWLVTVCRTYRDSGKLLEKYDVETVRPGGGGEYPLQDGFGWTNGVTRALLDDYAGPGSAAARACAADAAPR